jgi:myo-inositol-1(or 4)-monophosphatase
VDLSTELEFAAAAARDAGAALLERFTGDAVATRSKERRQEVVTQADVAAEALLLERIRAEWPEDGVLAEESGASPERSGRRWCVDPLDGTANYASGAPHWAVTVALLDDADRAVLAVTHDPLRGETFTATVTQPARLNGERIAVAEVAAVEDAVIADNLPYRARRPGWLRTRMESSRGLRETGSMALDLAWVARGRFHAAAHGRNERLWDYAGGELLVVAAGGSVVTAPEDPALAFAGPPALVAALVKSPVRMEQP